MGLLYKDGKGVPEDPVKAYFWLTLASNQGQNDAKAARAALATKLSKDEVAKAEEMARNWKPKQTAARPIP